jgi:hypothetical protein
MAAETWGRHVSAPMPRMEMGSTLSRHGAVSSPGLPVPVTREPIQAGVPGARRRGPDGSIPDHNGAGKTPATPRDREDRVHPRGAPPPPRKVVSRSLDHRGQPAAREVLLRFASLPAPAGGSVLEIFSGRRGGCGGFHRAIE